MEIKQRVKKHFSHKTIKIILTKRRYYLPLVYILVNIGFIVSSLYPKGLYLNSYIYPLIFVVLPYTCFFLQVIYDYFFQNSDEEFKKKFSIIYFIIGYSSMICLPLLLGFHTFNNFNPDLTFYYFVILISYSFFASLVCNTQLKYRLLIKYPNNINEKILQSLLLIGILMSIFILASPQIIISLTNTLNLNLSEMGTLTNIAIAFVVLCATLSALSFTYCSTIKNNDNKNYCKMKKNGEGFFISTILSMISLIVIYIFSLMSHVINLTNIFRLTIIDFIFINIYAIALIFLVSLSIYVIYYMVVSSFSTLKILGLID
ncbi:hypothetical protein [uncultured Methanobrevibacter sp.]|uniref:hypothetical protein n=1 Tax=uncultured Methanobrevibacter sp. TaxID=253161 RepID=UPI0025FD20D5|nr:hypothetical protein [uncultured Methanobrevibacter sp.]